MPSSHKHSDCAHTFKLCDTCDVVWCHKCDAEWGGESCTISGERHPLIDDQYWVSATTSMSMPNEIIIYERVATTPKYDHRN
jgi:hypothetical protein